MVDDVLVGRQPELAELRRAMRQHRVVALVGPGGIGKSRLALRWMEEQSDRPTLVQLADRSGPQEVFQAVAEQIGATLGNAATDDEAVGILGVALSELDRPVVLDTAEGALEQLAGAVGQWAEHVPILLTSRIAPTLGHAIHLEPLGLDDAMALFEQRAPRGIPESFRGDLPALIDRIGGNPLVIELIAARSGLASPRQLLDRLQLDALSDISGTQPPRHASLDAVIDASWRLLEPRDRQTLAAVSAFRGPVTVDEVADVVGPDAWLSLERLRTSSLVFARDAPDGVILAPYDEVRAFVRKTRPLTPDESLALARATVRRCIPVAGALFTPRHVDARPHFVRRALDLLGAWELEVSALATGFFDDLALYRQLVLHLPTSQVRPMLRKSLDLELDPRVRGAVLASLAMILRREGQREDAIALLDAGMESSPDPVARAYLRAVWLFEQLHRVPFAEGPSLIEDATQAARSLEAGGAPGWMTAFAWRIAGILRRVAGDTTGAIEALEASLVAYRAHADLAGVGSVLCQLAFVHGVNDRPWRTFIDEALEVAEVLGNEPFFVAVVRTNQAYIQGYSGDLEGFDETLSHAISAMRRRGDADQVDRLQVAGAMTTTLTLDPDSAAERIDRVLTRLAHWKGRALYRELCTARGWCDHVRGDLDGAMAWYAASDPGRPAFERDTLVALALAESGADPSDLYPSLADGCPAQGVREALVAWSAPDPGPLPVRTEGVRPGRWVLAVLARAGQTRAVDIDAAGDWFESGTERTSLGRRKAARKILAALALARQDSPGEVVEPEALIEAGWPGERILPQSARQRLHSTIYDLRSLGLDEVLQNKGDGYALDPARTRVVPSPRSRM